MGKTAFLFPGQGSQRAGMGSRLLDADPDLYRRHLDRADEISGLPIRELSLEGPSDELTRTEVAQPALFALSLALADAAAGAGLRPDVVAGHSLGEYTAAVVCGALEEADGMRLVVRRGRLMADIQSERPGAMAAIIGIPAERVAELCDAASDAGIVAPANLNSPSQVVCSGEEAAIERLLELAAEAEARKAVRLQVGAAFHSELMAPVQQELSAEMARVSWRDPDVPLVSNASGKLVDGADDIRQALIDQIASPVRWEDCVRAMVDAGCEAMVELGPGRVLTGLVRQIDPEMQTFNVDAPAQLADVADAAR